jgi:putative toxin-antitoxin system antitoxin component (TIGR02293 family)
MSTTKTERAKPRSAGSRPTPVPTDARSMAAAVVAEKAEFGSTVLTGSRRRVKPAARAASGLVYVNTKGVDDFVGKVWKATPMQLVDAERKGVAGRFLKDIAKRMDIPAARMFTILGVPKATAEKKAAAGDVIKGNGGRAALGLARLLGIARELVENSTAEGAGGFDSARWLGQWLERPQPALGGRKPADLIDTAAGLEAVARLLGSIESGAYQ